MAAAATTATSCCSARPTPASSPRRRTMPGALIEPLFVTDPFEGTLAASPSAQQVIARGIARAVEQYLGTGPDSADGCTRPRP